MFSHHKHARGQASLEMMLTTAVIFLLAIAVVGYFNSIKDSTVAMIVLKTEALGAIADEDTFYSITSIEILNETNDNIELNINTDPAIGSLQLTNLEGRTVCDLIKDKTKYKLVSISVNRISACSVP